MSLVFIFYVKTEEDYTFGCDQPATRVPPCAGFVDFNDKKRRKPHRGTETEVNVSKQLDLYVCVCISVYLK